jgi:DNA-binding response OmpR family regulator
MDTKPIILIVEDSPTQAKQIAATVISQGARAVIVSNGLDALTEVHNEFPALIILDVNLPKMDGFQICNRLKRDPVTAHIPVIMLTSVDSANATIKGLNVGADDYIPKDTFATDNLIVAIKALLKVNE